MSISANRSTRYGQCEGLLQPGVLLFGVPDGLGEIARLNWTEVLSVAGALVFVECWL